MFVLSLRHTDGRPLALLAITRCTMSGVGPGHLSADYYGVFCDRVCGNLKAGDADPPFVALMSNGTSADINNVDFPEGASETGPHSQIRRVADDVAAEVARVERSLRTNTRSNWVPPPSNWNSLCAGLPHRGRSGPEPIARSNPRGTTPGRSFTPGSNSSSPTTRDLSPSPPGLPGRGRGSSNGPGDLRGDRSESEATPSGVPIVQHQSCERLVRDTFRRPSSMHWAPTKRGGGRTSPLETNAIPRMTGIRGPLALLR